MPETAVQGTPKSETQALPQGSVGTGTGQAAFEMPEKFKGKSPEEIVKGYTELESKFGSQGEELGQLRKTAEQTAQERQQYLEAVQAWQTWYEQNLKPRWNDIEQLLTGQAEKATRTVAQTQPTQPAQPTEWFQDWETLPPREQAKRLQNASADYILQALTPAITKWQEGVAQRFTEAVTQQQKFLEGREQYYQNYLNLYRKVMDMKLADPTIDVDKVLDQAVQVMSNKIDPLELGRKLAYSGVDEEHKIKQAVESARKDWEQEQKNKELAAVSPTNGMPPVFKVSSAAPGGMASQREFVAKKLVEKFGPGIFR